MEGELLTTFLAFSEPRPTLLQAPSLGAKGRGLGKRSGRQPTALGAKVRVCSISAHQPRYCLPPALLPEAPPHQPSPLLLETPHPIAHPVLMPLPLFHPSANSWGRLGMRPVCPMSRPPRLLLRPGFLGRDQHGSWFTSSHPRLGPVRPQWRGLAVRMSPSSQLGVGTLQEEASKNQGAAVVPSAFWTKGRTQDHTVHPSGFHSIHNRAHTRRGDRLATPNPCLSPPDLVSRKLRVKLPPGEGTVGPLRLHLIFDLPLAQLSHAFFFSVYCVYLCKSPPVLSGVRQRARETLVFPPLP